MGRVRICQLVTELGPGGAERIVYELATRLDKGRLDVQVAALRGGEVAGWLAEAGVKTTILGVLGKWDIRKLCGLADLLRRERIDLLHTHLFHADLAGRLAAGLAGVPHLVHTIHTAEGRFRPWQFAFARLASGRCDRLICVSQSVRTWHARRSGLPLWRYAVIPNGIDADAFGRDEQARRRLRAEWGAGEDDVIVVFVGRLHRDKGIDTLLAAMSHLSARGNPKDLVIAGDGPERNMVKTFVSHGEGGTHCRWLGLRRDVRDILSAADVFAMPSRWEGFGLALGEAMAGALPVVATRVPGIRDLITDGDTGLLVDRDDVTGFAEALNRLVSDADLRNRLGSAAKRHVTERYSIGEMIAAHERLYADVVGDRTGQGRSAAISL
ncbi:MAG TPA: glycosyltransferase [Phycisphaerae bacterium]|nr:glycosyltransferase [Phycisphaerae bacterium]